MSVSSAAFFQADRSHTEQEVLGHSCGDAHLYGQSKPLSQEGTWGSSGSSSLVSSDQIPNKREFLLSGYLAAGQSDDVASILA